MLTLTLRKKLQAGTLQPPSVAIVAGGWSQGWDIFCELAGSESGGYRPEVVSAGRRLIRSNCTDRADTALCTRRREDLRWNNF
jgi:hypothetical protein